jgi:hypothetical protein
VTEPADWAGISGQLKNRATAGDGIATVLRGPLEAAGTAYAKRVGSTPLVETPEHVAWRAQMTAALVARDKLGRAVDGGPLTTVDPADPAAASTTVTQRLTNAGGRAPSGSGLAAAIAAALRVPLPSEPTRYTIDANRPRDTRSVAEIEADVRKALAPADAYLQAVNTP